MAGVTRSLEEIASITILVPLFLSSWKEWYIQTIKRPDTGRKTAWTDGTAENRWPRKLPWKNRACRSSHRTDDQSKGTPFDKVTDIGLHSGFGIPTFHLIHPHMPYISL